MPFKWYPKEELLTQIAAWRMIDLSESNGERIDLVIGTIETNYPKQPKAGTAFPLKATFKPHSFALPGASGGQGSGGEEHGDAKEGIHWR